MSQRPTSPYEAAWQQWNYGGGASRGEPMPRIEDYPDTFEEDPSGGPMATDMPAKRGKVEYDRTAPKTREGDLRQLGLDNSGIPLPVNHYDPSGRGQVMDEYGQPVSPGYTSEDRLYASPASPDAVYGAYAPMPGQPGMGSNVMGGAMGNAMGRSGMANALLGGALGSAIKKNPGLLKRAAGGLMGAMTLGQLNRRKGY